VFKNRFSSDFFFIYAVTFLLALAILLPILVILFGSCVNTSFLGISSEQWVGGGDGFITMKWYRYVLGLYGSSMLFSLKIAFMTVIACLLVGVPGSYVLASKPFFGSRLIEELVLLPLSVPGIVMSIALIQAYGRLRGHWWFLLAGHLVYTIPFMVRSITNTLRSFDIGRLELAAQNLGAGFWQRLWLVVLPNLRHAMIIGCLLVFAISWGEFNVSFLLNTPLNQTYPAALYGTYTSNSFQVSSAATAIFLLGLLPVLIAIQWLGGDDLVKIEQGS